ncbi:chromosome partitioning protein ParB [Solicola sp. PLA-1-18]|uniref:chromosome partitioning protein ParB n=1 Tax=Solicola sp. PLA-1-18 TaxID=3380532 RepID=UPI003B7AB6B9
MARDTGSPRADAESDFLRVRRRQVMSALAAWIRRDDDVAVQPLSFTEIVDALGTRSSRNRGFQVIDIDKIVGSVDKMREFDHRFRPTSGRHRQRWERLALAARRGEAFPPIEVYQVGSSYFVRDGHHRVSVARAMGLNSIEAQVTEIETTVDPAGLDGRTDVEATHFRRLLHQRVPLPPEEQDAIACTEPVRSALLAEMVEAWGCRLMHREQTYLDRDVVARRWFDEEFRPTIALIRDADLVDRRETDGDAYIRVAGERYHLIRAHVWNEEVIRRLREQRR